MYFVFEGVDGVGKSTQIKRVTDKLSRLREVNKKYDFELYTIAEKEIVPNDKYDQIEQVLQYALQRRILTHKLKNDISNDIFSDTNRDIVLGDRSFYSSLAYQHDLGYNMFVNKFAPKPLLVFYFMQEDVDPYFKIVQKRYEKVLPYNTVKVDTLNYSISETTDYITNEILNEWNENIVKRGVE